MVILTHTPWPNSAGSLVLSSISLLTAPCIGLFFMISGALLLPVLEPTSCFLKRRFAKIIIPAVLWSMFYLFAEFFYSRDFGTLLKSILSIPFSVQGCGIYWFIYVLVGLYLLAPILSLWLQKASKREMEFYLFLWLITMCYPIIRPFLYINEGKTGILYYFGGYVGYFVLGYYLHNCVTKWHKWMSAVLLVVPIGCAVICKLSDLQVDFYDMFFYLSLSSVFICIAVFMWGKEQFNGKPLDPVWTKIVTDFSNCSFGIYFVHFVVIRNIIWKIGFLTQIAGGGGILWTFIMAVIISWGIVHLISRVPRSEYLIGVKIK